MKRIKLEAARKRLNETKPLYVVGWSGGHHDAAMAIVRYEGENVTLVAAEHMERWTGVKNDKQLDAVVATRMLSKIPNDSDVLFVAHQKFWGVGGSWAHRTETIAAHQVNVKVLEVALREQELRHHDWKLRVVGQTAVSHHESHAWAAWGTSNKTNAIVLVNDALGETESMTVWFPDSRGGIKKYDKGTIKYPHSLGLFYSAWTGYLGLTPNEHEYKVMAMATDVVSGSKRYEDTVSIIASLTQLEREALELNWHRGVSYALNSKAKSDWKKVLDALELSELDEGEKRHVLAGVVQRIYQNLLSDAVEGAFNYNGAKAGTTFLLSGGCALNCSANHHIEQYMNELYGSGSVGMEAFSNPGDAGSSLGAALAFGQKRLSHQYDPLIGQQVMTLMSARFDGGNESSTSDLVASVVAELKKNGVVAVFTGGNEFGPRALGNRSILALPSVPKDRLDAMKGRESWQPFGCVVLDRHTPLFFEVDVPFHSPYMNRVVHWRQSLIEDKKWRAIQHTDGTARVQTVSSSAREGEWQGTPYLVGVLEQMMNDGIDPILVNTSLNAKGSPMSVSEAEAIEVAKSMNIKLVVG